MIDSSSVQIRRRPLSAVSAALSAMRGAPQIVTAYVVLIVLVQSFSSLFLSDDLWARKGFHSGDAIAIGLSLFLQSYFWCGLLIVAIHRVRGQPALLINIFLPLGVYLRATIVALVMSIPVALGFLLLIVPGVYLVLMWSVALPLLCDARARFFDSLRLSADLTKGLRGELFLVWLVFGLMQAPANIIDRISDRLEFFESSLGLLTLLIVGLWQILVTGFGAFLLGVLYQHLQERRGFGKPAIAHAATPQDRRFGAITGEA